MFYQGFIIGILFTFLALTIYSKLEQISNNYNLPQVFLQNCQNPHQKPQCGDLPVCPS